MIERIESGEIEADSLIVVHFADKSAEREGTLGWSVSNMNNLEMIGVLEAAKADVIAEFL